MSIIDEPVRGRIPPPWFTALPGLERMRALRSGVVARPPVHRLLGIAPGDVSPGSSTWTMLASDWMGGSGFIEMSALAETSLYGAATTSLSPGDDLELLSLQTHTMRPSRPQPGSFLARAQLISASRFFIHAQTEIFDPTGRQIMNGTGQFAIRTVTPPPPMPPASLRPIDEPSYELPDPVLRPIPSSIGQFDFSDHAHVQAALERLTQGQYGDAFSELLGWRIGKFEPSCIEFEVPASEWFAGLQHGVAPGVIAMLTNSAGWFVGLLNHEAEESFVGLHQGLVLRHSAPVDGRPLCIRVDAAEKTDDGRTSSTARVTTADGVTIAEGLSGGATVPEAERLKRSRSHTKRTLATLVFSDVVSSTEQLARLGDVEWAKVKDQHHDLLRIKIAEHYGVEVDTAGDGFFVRFESPAQALEYARAIQGGIARLGIQLRIGIHAGECEIRGRDVTGMAVHVAARLEGAADAGEIIVSEVVKTLVMGSSHTFDDRGERELKGVPGTWRIFALGS